MQLDQEEIHHPIGQEDIHIVPVIAGAGRGVGKILLGAALLQVLLLLILLYHLVLKVVLLGLVL